MILITLLSWKGQRTVIQLYALQTESCDSRNIWKRALHLRRHHFWGRSNILMQLKTHATNKVELSTCQKLLCALKVEDTKLHVCWTEKTHFISVVALAFNATRILLIVWSLIALPCQETPEMMWAYVDWGMVVTTFSNSMTFSANLTDVSNTHYLRCLCIEGESRSQLFCPLCSLIVEGARDDECKIYECHCLLRVVRCDCTWDLIKTEQFTW